MKHHHAVLRLVLATLLSGLGTTLAAAEPKTLRMIPFVDLKVLDPSFTTAYVTRNFGYMVYDTLFARDAQDVPRPQMVGRYSQSADGLQWRFTLRPGLEFSDGSAVTSTDAVASIARWAARDGIGRAMTAAGAQWKAQDAGTFTLALREPFGLVLEGLSKPSSFPLFVMPERLARLPLDTPISEVLGSGPFVFRRDEWVPGSKVVFARNPRYAARSEAPSFLAGSKKTTFDRVEWIVMPDTNTAVAALQKGEVDYIEQVAPDYIPALRADPNTRIDPTGPAQAWIVVNHLHPPFNRPEARRALLEAISQEKFLAAMGQPLDMRITHCVALFLCGGSNETQAGAVPGRVPDLAKARRLLTASGYKGEPVTLMVPSDIAMLNALGLMTAQALASIGVNVDLQVLDWGTIVARRSRKDAPAAGGWNALVTSSAGLDADSPVTHIYLGAACGNNLPGWPCDSALDALRAEWMHGTSPAARKPILDRVQARAYDVLPVIPAGQFAVAAAARRSLRNADRILNGIPTVWMLDK